MDQILMQKIVEYLEGRSTISVPLLQQKFGICYAEAREAMDCLSEAGATEFDSGIEFRIIPDRLSCVLESEYEEDDFEDQRYREAIRELERRRAELLALVQNDNDEWGDEDETEDEDDEYIIDDDDIQFALVEAGIDLDDLIQAIELGQKVTSEGRFFTISVIIRGLGCSFSRAERLLNFMRDRGYAVCELNNCTQYMVNISDEELQQLKSLNDED